MAPWITDQDTATMHCRVNMVGKISAQMKHCHISSSSFWGKVYQICFEEGKAG